MCTDHKEHEIENYYYAQSSVLLTVWEHVEMSGNTDAKKGIMFLDL